MNPRDDAFTDLQDALDASGSGDEIWVAAGAGDYKPSEMTSPPNNRSKTFQLLEGRMLYGGFPAASGDPSWVDRDWLENTTTLSGDINDIGDDDSYHVVKGADDAVIDGFVISGGRAGLLN